MIGRVKLAAGVLLGRTTTTAGRSLMVFPDDLFIVSYPRSGNTWARFLVGNLVYHEEPITFSNIEVKVPDIYQNSDRALRHLPRPRILKSHEYFDPRYRKVIYIVRDPRDVAVSYYHYHLKTRRVEDGYPIDRYVSRFTAGELDPFGSWGENVGSWLGARQDTSGFMLIRYEDLLRQPIEGLRRIASFVGVPATRNELDRAMELSSVENMRRLESQQSHVWRPVKASRTDKPFIRSAKSGEWKTKLPDRAVREIQSVWRTQMRLVGYTP